jgi:hypothetical protein
MLKQYKQIIHFLLTDKNVLYLTLGAAVLNLAMYAIMREFEAIIFFLIMGFLTSAFSKNMIIIMLTAIVSTFFVVLVKIFTKVREGFKQQQEAEEEEEDAIENMTDLQPADFEDVDSDVEEDETDKKNKPAKAGAGAKAKASAKAGPSAKARASAKASASAGGGPKGAEKPQINYASTLEAAYDNLDKLLSSDALKNMSVDTQRLASKQQNLMGNIEKLTPMIGNAQRLMDSMNVDGMADKILSFQQKLGLGGSNLKGKGKGKGGDADPDTDTDMDLASMGMDLSKMGMGA